MKTIIFTPVHFRNIWLLETQLEVLKNTIPSHDFIYYPICNNSKTESEFKTFCTKYELESTIVHENPITYEPSLNHTYAMHKGFNDLLLKRYIGVVKPYTLYMPIDSDIFPCRRLSEEEIEKIYERGYYGHWKDNQKHIKYLFIGTSIFSEPFLQSVNFDVNFDLTCIGDSGSYNFLPDRGAFRNKVDWSQISSYYDCEWRCLMVEGKEFWFQIHDKTWIHLVGGSRQAYGGPPLYVIEKAIKIIAETICNNPDGAYNKLIAMTVGKK